MYTRTGTLCRRTAGFGVSNNVVSIYRSNYKKSIPCSPAEIFLVQDLSLQVVETTKE